MDRNFPFAFQVLNGATFSWGANSTNLFSLLTVPNLINVTDIDKSRVVASSLLCTYMGSTLNNGGQITSTRLPPGAWRGVVGDYQVAASRIYDTYDGPLSEGSYAWNLMQSFSEFDFIDSTLMAPDLLDTHGCVVMNCKRDDPTQTMRARIFLNVEGFGTNTPFEMKYTMYNPHFWEMIHFLRALPAATDNPEHSNIIDKICDCCQRKSDQLSKPHTVRSPFVDTLKDVSKLATKIPGPVGEIASLGQSLLDLF